VKLSGRIEKSETDYKEYRGLLLDNGLQVLLIQDKNCTIAGASLAIGVGSLNDPVELPGLSHFLEHSVFLGNKKYPHPIGFESFLGEKGGLDNAETGRDYTAYYFDVSPDALFETMDRYKWFMNIKYS